MRLDKFLSNYSGLSRKEAKQAIKTGEVLVEEKAITDPQFKVSEDSVVRLNGLRIQAMGPRYFMLHKPAGYVCANSDSTYPTVISLLWEDDNDSLQVVGRLDVDTTGLVLITDDGQWNHRVTSPRHKMEKLYRVTLQDPVQDCYVAEFAEGILLREEKKRTRPAQLKKISEHEVELVIHEGKYHQVKRMFAAMGNHVTRLHRARIGQIELDETLPPGEYRPLTPSEIDSVVQD